MTCIVDRRSCRVSFPQLVFSFFFLRSGNPVGFQRRRAASKSTSDHIESSWHRCWSAPGIWQPTANRRRSKYSNEGFPKPATQYPHRSGTKRAILTAKSSNHRANGRNATGRQYILEKISTCRIFALRVFYTFRFVFSEPPLDSSSCSRN